MIKRLGNLCCIGSKGSAIVELAIMLPTILAILYYTIDSPKHQRSINSMREVVYMATGLLQSKILSQSTEATKKISKIDIQQIISASFLSFFGQGNKYLGAHLSGGLGYSGGCSIFYLVCETSGKAKIMWSATTQDFNETNILTLAAITANSGSTNIPESIVAKSCNYATEISFANVHKDLKMSVGESKIIINVYLKNYAANSKSFAKKMGFLFFNPSKSSDVNNTYYHQVLIFRPVDGGFLKTMPV